MSTELVPVTPAVRPQATWLVDQLPSVLADDEFLRRFLGIFEEITDSVVQRVDGLHHIVDPSVAPLEAVRKTVYATGYPKERFHFVAGDILETVPVRARPPDLHVGLDSVAGGERSSLTHHGTSHRQE